MLTDWNVDRCCQMYMFKFASNVVQKLCYVLVGKAWRSLKDHRGGQDRPKTDHIIFQHSLRFWSPDVLILIKSFSSKSHSITSTTNQPQQIFLRVLGSLEIDPSPHPYTHHALNTKLGKRKWESKVFQAEYFYLIKPCYLFQMVQDSCLW